VRTVQQQARVCGLWYLAMGLTKGYYFEVDYVAVDRAGNDNGWKYRVQKLTS